MPKLRPKVLLDQFETVTTRPARPALTHAYGQVLALNVQCTNLSHVRLAKDRLFLRASTFGRRILALVALLPRGKKICQSDPLPISGLCPVSGRARGGGFPLPPMSVSHLFCAPETAASSVSAVSHLEDMVHVPPNTVDRSPMQRNANEQFAMWIQRVAVIAARHTYNVGSYRKRNLFCPFQLRQARFSVLER